MTYKIEVNQFKSYFRRKTGLLNEHRDDLIFDQWRYGNFFFSPSIEIYLIDIVIQTRQILRVCSLIFLSVIISYA